MQEPSTPKYINFGDLVLLVKAVGITFLKQLSFWQHEKDIMRKIAFITFGCTLNVSDSELMAGLLAKDGFKIVKTLDDADLVVVNSCSVKNMAESKFFKALRECEKEGKRIVAAGCVPQAEKSYLDTKLKHVSVLGTKQLNRIVDVVEETLAGNVIHLLGEGENARHGIPKVRRSDVIGIIPISEGCLGDCTYCKARLARGSLVSYPIADIVKEVKTAVKEGCREIWLTGQDCGTYGRDIDSSLPELLKKVLSVDGDFFVRLGMANPNFVKDFADDLVSLYKRYPDKLFRFIHIPLQSGNDRILKSMNRKYSKKDFMDLCVKLRASLPDITIATDVICGFPTETEEEFDETLELLKVIRPDVVNRSRFWPRPGTKAAGMKQLSGTITNNRSRRLNDLLKKLSLERNRFWKDWSGRVVIDEQASSGRPVFVGRNYAYKPFVMDGHFRLGECLNVKSDKPCVFHIEASKSS